jgi:hypothetical protein
MGGRQALRVVGLENGREKEGGGGMGINFQLVAT